MEGTLQRSLPGWRLQVAHVAGHVSVEREGRQLWHNVPPKQSRKKKLKRDFWPFAISELLVARGGDLRTAVRQRVVASQVAGMLKPTGGTWTPAGRLRELWREPTTRSCLDLPSGTTVMAVVAEELAASDSAPVSRGYASLLPAGGVAGSV